MSIPRPASRKTACVSIVIPTWNGASRVSRCLESLVDEQVAQILIVDNGSRTDEQRAIEETARRDSRTRIVRLAQNRGFAAGCNAGLREVTTPFAAVLNDDTRCGPSAISTLVSALRRNARVGFAAPRSNYVKGRQMLADDAYVGVDGRPLAHEDVEAIEAMLCSRARSRVEDVEHLSGLCLLGEAETWRALEGFDERFGIGNYEDDDLCVRTRKAGLRLLIAHDSYVWHEGNATFSALGLDYAAQIDAQRAIFESKWSSDALALAELASLEHDHDRVRALEAELRALPSPERQWASAVLARCEDAENDIGDALHEWEELLRVAPLHVEAACARALACTSHGRDDEAEAMMSWIESALPLDPVPRASLHTQRARILIGRQAIEAARMELDRAQSALGDYTPAINLRAVLAIMDCDWKQALELLEPLAHSEDPDILTNLGIARYRSGDVRRAIEAFHAGRDLGGADSIAARNLAALASASVVGTTHDEHADLGHVLDREA